MPIEEKSSIVEFIYTPHPPDGKPIIGLKLQKFKVVFSINKIDGEDVSVVSVKDLSIPTSEPSVFRADFFAEVTDFLRSKKVISDVKKGETVNNSTSIPITNIKRKEDQSEDNEQQELVSPIVSFDTGEKIISKDINVKIEDINVKTEQAKTGIEVDGKEVNINETIDRSVIRDKTIEESDILRKTNTEKTISRK